MQSLRAEGLRFQKLEVLELRMQDNHPYIVPGLDLVAPLHLCGSALRCFRLSGPEIDCARACSCLLVAQLTKS